MHSLICRSEKVFDKTVNQLARNHPYILMIVLGIVMPLMTLIAVAVSSTAIMLPISLLLGWI